MKKLISIVFVILSMSFTAQTAQAQVNDLSEQDIQAFKDRVGEVIDMFQNNLSILGAKKHSMKVKSVYKKSALKLFIGEGLPYTDPDGNKRKGVLVEVSSIKSGKTTKHNIYRISNIYKVGDHYEATATIFQRFEGYIGKEMKKKYSDVTQKNIKVYIIPENDYVLGMHWSVRLGDIEVVDTISQ